MLTIYPENFGMKLPTLSAMFSIEHLPEFSTIKLLMNSSMGKSLKFSTSKSLDVMLTC